MNRVSRALLASAIAGLALLYAGTAIAQSDEDAEQLKIAALEALMAAPSDRALPAVARVMESDNSDEVKARALFVLSQIDDPEAHRILLDTARTAGGELQLQAIRMIGISGDTDITAELGDVYRDGSEEVKESVLRAYMISDNAEAVYEIAAETNNPEELERAVNVLGTMGATEQLKRLRDHPGASESLIHAYAVSGDTESLLVLARDSSDSERQLRAIHGLSIAGGDEVGPALVDIYRDSGDRDVRRAVMHALMVAGDDDGLLELFRSSDDAQEKSELLRQLVIMDSDAAMEAIDQVLSEGP